MIVTKAADQVKNSVGLCETSDLLMTHSFDDHDPDRREEYIVSVE